MHRVVNMTSIGNNADVISNHKSAISAKLDNYNQDNIHDRQINDGQNMEGKPTLGINIDFNSATDANNFHDWLRQYVTNNSSDFVSARTRVHDCFHASGENLPCEIGDTWELSTDGSE